MTNPTPLQTAFQQHPFGLYRRFMRLTDDQKDKIMRLFARHLQACKSNDCSIDPRWLPEVIEDVKRGLL